MDQLIADFLAEAAHVRCRPWGDISDKQQRRRVCQGELLLCCVLGVDVRLRFDHLPVPWSPPRYPPFALALQQVQLLVLLLSAGLSALSPSKAGGGGG